MPNTDDFEGREDRDEKRPRQRRDYDDESGPPRSNPFGVIALVLGLAQFICLIFTGIPAIICGIIGLSRSREANGAGRGMAIAGIVLGAFSFVYSFIVCMALILPAVQKVREAASRAMTTNNAKQIDLALQNAQGREGFPRAGYDPKKVGFKNGQGLSWRVGVLPFLEQKSLHDSFALDQSWDSPANRSLSDTVIPAYTNPDEMTAQTRFQVFVGPNTVFDPSGKRIAMTDIPDGTVNTLLFVEAGTSVPWASPQDIPYTPNGALPAFGRPGQSGFLVGFADGSVRIIKKTVNAKWMHAMIQINDGVPVDPASLND